MSTYEPGTVAMVVIFGDCLEKRAIFDGEHWLCEDGSDWSGLKNIRPIAVIDPESDEDIQRLARLFSERVRALDATEQLCLEDALRAYAAGDGKPVPEPTGLGAVVKARADWWTRKRTTSGGYCWLSLTSGELVSWEYFRITDPAQILYHGAEVES